MKPTKLLLILGLAAAMSACSSRNETASSNGSNISDPGPLNDDTTAAALLSVDNYQQRVGYALYFFANEQLPGPRMAFIADHTFSIGAQLVTDDGTGTTTYQFTCSNGGTATRAVDDSSQIGVTLDGCQVDNTIFDGQLVHSFGKYHSDFQYSNAFTADIDGGAAVHEVSGTITNRRGSPPCASRYRERSVDYYKVTQSNDTFEIKNWTTNYEKHNPFANLCDTDSLEVSGGFSIRSPETGGSWLEVSTTQKLERSGADPLSGVISIVAEDSSSITLNANNSADDNVVVTITNKDGLVEFEQSLSTWESSLEPL